MTSVTEAIRQRHSTRAFTQQTVARETLEEILELARLAPSGVNTQPWQVAVVSGAKKQQLEQAMLGEFAAGRRGKMQYDYYPEEWVSPYKERRVETGKLLYGAVGIGREDKDRQIEQWAKNFRAFGAPMSLYFFLDPVLARGSFFDYGMFVQNIMLLAIERGLATCAQGSLGEYHELIKENLGYQESLILLGGLALGYEDKENPVNQYRTPRQPVESFCRFF